MSGIASVLAALTLLAAGAAGAAETQPEKPGMAGMPGTPLDGSTFNVNVRPDKAAAAKGEKAFDDTIVFAGGKVEMTECVKYGFAASKYTAAKKAEGRWAFTTEQSSDPSGKSVWHGVIEGSAVKGTLVWTKKDGTVLHYSFDGKKAEKGAAK